MKLFVFVDYLEMSYLSRNYRDVFITRNGLSVIHKYFYSVSCFWAFLLEVGSAFDGRSKYFHSTFWSINFNSVFMKLRTACFKQYFYLAICWYFNYVICCRVTYLYFVNILFTYLNSRSCGIDWTEINWLADGNKDKASHYQYTYYLYYSQYVMRR